MINRPEYKILDNIVDIDFYTMNDIFGCTDIEAGELLTNYFKSRKRIKSSLDLYYIPNIQSLYDVKWIDGNFIAVSNNMSDLGNLSIVNGTIEIGENPITSLGKLTYCTGIEIYNTQLFEINKLNEVNGNVKISNSPLNNLGSLKLVGGKLVLISLSNLNNMGDILNVFDDVIIINCPKLNSLNNLEYIGGSLDLRESDISDFGQLNNIDGFVITKKSNVLEIPTDLEVISLDGLKIINEDFPKCKLVKIPKMHNLHDFGLIIINDEYNKWGY